MRGHGYVRISSERTYHMHRFCHVQFVLSRHDREAIVICIDVIVVGVEKSVLTGVLLLFVGTCS